MRLGRVLAALAVLALLGAAGLYTHWEGAPSAPEASGEPLKAAPGFQLTDFQGKAHRLADFRGQVVILHFWATWCPPCLEEIKEWVEAARRFRTSPIHWVAISMDKTWSEAHQSLPNSDLPGNLVSLLDPTLKVSETYGSYQFPETYIIGPDQRIIAKWVGPQKWGAPEMADAIKKLGKL